MSEPTWVDTDQMGKIMPAIQDLVTQFSEVHAVLLSSSTQAADAAGDDAAGRAFKEQFTPMSNQISGSVQDGHKIMLGMVDGINTMIGGYTHTEEANTVNQPKTS